MLSDTDRTALDELLAFANLNGMEVPQLRAGYDAVAKVDVLIEMDTLTQETFWKLAKICDEMNWPHNVMRSRYILQDVARLVYGALAPLRNEPHRRSVVAMQQD